MKLKQIVKAMKGEPPAALTEKAREAAYKCADENNVPIERVCVRASVFGTVHAFVLPEEVGCESDPS